MGLYEEIRSQPQVMEHVLGANRAPIGAVCAGLGEMQSVFIAARGSSDNAARYAKYVLEVFNQMPVALAAPSVFARYRAAPRLDGALVMAISQSGQSPDILAVVEAARAQRRPTLAVTNATDSPLARAADCLIDIHAGLEQAVAATKSYTAQLLAIAMLSCLWAEDFERFGQLGRLPEWARQVLALEDPIARAAQRYRYMESCVVLGRGYNYATAFEWALKLKELAYVVAEPYSPADFLHGPIAMVASGFPVMAIAPGGAVYEGMLALLQSLKAEVRAELVVISDQREALALAEVPIPLPQGIPEWLSPLVSIIPAQLFVYHLTRARGLDTEQPRLIQKVTRTE